MADATPADTDVLITRIFDAPREDVWRAWKTRMTLSDAPYPPAARGNVEAGWHAAFEKLAARVRDRRVWR